jgi:transposase-like protein
MKCPNCEVGKLIIVTAYEPWNLEHYQCVKCDSTYSMGEIVEIAYEEEGT